MELEGLYRDIVEASADGIWVFDLAGRTQYANPALAAMFGTSQDEFSRLTVFDSLDEDGREQFAEHLRMLAEGRFNTEAVESKFVRRDGSSLWVLVGESALHAPDGSLTGVLHRLSDYSDRRKTLDELTLSQRQLAEAQRIARIGSWEWDVERDEISVSAGLLALYGLDPDVFPVSYADFLSIVHEDDRAQVDEAVQAARTGGRDFVFVARVQGTDDWVWTRGRGVAQYDESGAVVAMSGTHQDVTETKLAEIALQDQVSQNTLMQAVATAANEARKLDDVLAQGQHLVLLHDDWKRARAFIPAPDGQHLEPFHVSAEERLGDDPQPEQGAMELALATRVWREGAPAWDEKRLSIGFPIRFRDEVFAVLVITSAPPLHRHEMIEAMTEQVAVQLGRVVEREESERALAAARDDAMEASLQKSQFLATMSHEIRTPLNGVIGLNDLLLRTHLDPDQQRLASGVQVASRALLSQINDILDFSKIEAGKLQLEYVDFDVRAVFDQVANVLGEAARAKGLELMVSCDPGVPEMLTGDPTRLAQVITNLGSNAVKFTEGGEVRVRATASDVEGRPLLQIEVHDTGIGIADSEVDDLFDTFTQADTSTTRVHGGTGLGLAISREIVHALGGEIGVTSTPGEGSVFWFTAGFDLPADSTSSTDDEVARTWLSGRRALVVEDNERHRLILEEQLGWWRMRPSGVASADDAEVALAGALLEGDPFEVVLIDMTLALPRRNGLNLAQAVRANPAYDDTVLLMLTSTTGLGTATVRQHGVADFLIKPVLAQALRTALLRHLADVEPAAAASGTERPATGPRRRVLVVEDNPVNQMVAVGLLDVLGYDSDVAEDGLVALDAVDAHPYDAILMDVQMPRLDGYATTRTIREREGPGQHVPVVAMTAAAVDGERERCLAAGMDDFLTKPVDPEILGATLAMWIGVEVTGLERLAGLGSRTDVGPPAPELDGLDLERLDMLRDLSPGDTTYLDRAIGNFVTNTPAALDTIRAALAAADPDALRQAAHKLAGGALNLGVVRAGEAARDLELLADEGTTEGGDALVPSLADELDAGRDALLRYQEAYRGGTGDAQGRTSPAS